MRERRPTGLIKNRPRGRPDERFQNNLFFCQVGRKTLTQTDVILLVVTMTVVLLQHVESRVINVYLLVFSISIIRPHRPHIGMHIGIIQQIRLTHPSAAAMWSYVKLL